MQHFRGLQLHSNDLTDPSLLAGESSSSSSSLYQSCSKDTSKQTVSARYAPVFWQAQQQHGCVSETMWSVLLLL
jgi:hypothetical protein